MNKILWLASWYPNKTSPFNGDFIKRHAEAAALLTPVHVIFVVKDQEGIATKRCTIENFTRGNLTESIVYYNPFKTGIRFLDRLISLVTYLKIFRSLSLKFIEKEGRPVLVHVHVTMWAGLVALMLKRKCGLPFMITEHWTGYDKNALANFYNRGWIFKELTRVILRSADLVLPVSVQLGTLINNIAAVKLIVVPNVVDTRYFTISKSAVAGCRFIHVSSMNRQKNVEAILNTFSKLARRSNNWRLIMIGPAGAGLIKFARKLGIENYLEWQGTLSYPAVAQALRQATAMVMFSRSENQPCVILEALCCGLPVISSKVGGIAEVITSKNGILLNSEDEPALLQALTEMMDNHSSYNREEISRTAVATYSYNTISKLFADLYSRYRV